MLITEPSLNPKSALQKGLRLAGYNLLTLVFLSLVVEGCIRLANPDILPLATDSVFLTDSLFGASPGLTPGATGRSMGQRFSVTEDGFWEYRSSRMPQWDEIGMEWLFLGDSVTMGMGVDPDSTFAGRLSARAADSLRVLNPSLIGYSSRDYVNILSEMAESDAHPITRVTVFWCLNDASSGSSEGEPPTEIRNYIPALTLFIYRHVRTYQWLKKRFFDRPKAYYEYDRSRYDFESAHFARAVTDIVAIKQYASDLGAELEFVLLPYEYQFRGGDRIPQHRMASVLDSLRIAYVDVALQMKNNIVASGLHDASDFYLYGDGIHFSMEGHRVVSEIVTELD